jgi:hypothetical protein
MCSGRGDGQLRPPGFPIRKSPDHCLVADFPGLIAGSNVLLRLLVPRHPPCALINLATTRCSRPLCSSQDTGGPATKPAAPAAGSHGPRETSFRPFPQDPTACPALSPPPVTVPAPQGAVLGDVRRRAGRITRRPQTSSHPGTSARDMALDAAPGGDAPGAP